MNVYEIKTMAERLAGNTYPGRGIVLGVTPDGTQAVAAYFIMGRSVNSRNRVFVQESDGIRTEAHDPSLMKDPHLIIYHPVREVGQGLIVTNGDQTDTVWESLAKGESWEAALRTRQFEDDGPNWTPRISGLQAGDGSYKMSILKAADPEGKECARYFYEYPATPGLGHFLHTYVCDLPITILNGRPGYINFLDALNSWQLVKELKEATGMASVTSFKHVSPTSAAVGKPLPDSLKKACFVDDVPELDDSPLACAYARARGTDRMCSFGDWVALSDVCDVTTAKLIAREVSDGVIAPGYTEEALAILKAKRKGGYNVVAIDPGYVPAEQETKQVFGITFQQGRNNFKINADLLNNIVTENKNLTESAKIDLIVALITLKYTQSNSVCFAYDGQAVGVGAGQQSRIHCTRLAGSKADTFFLRQHPKTLNLPFREDLGRPGRDNVIDGYINGNEEDVCAEGIWQNYFTRQPERLTEEDKKAFLAGFDGVALGSDAFFPFPDNIKRAKASGVRYIAQPGGSIRDDLVIEECNRDGIVMAFTGMRLFHH